MVNNLLRSTGRRRGACRTTALRRLPRITIQQYHKTVLALSRSRLLSSAYQPDLRCLLASEHFLDGLARVALRSFEGSTKRTVPDQLGGDTKGTGDTEQNGVELHLVQAIMRKDVSVSFLTIVQQ